MAGTDHRGRPEHDRDAAAPTEEIGPPVVWPAHDADRADADRAGDAGDAPAEAASGAATPPYRSRWTRRPEVGRRTGLVAAAVVGLCALLYGLDLAGSQERLPRDVTVSGVDVGGLTRTAAEQRLRADVGPRLANLVHVRAGDATAAVSPVRAGLHPDWQATLDAAGQQPLAPWTRLASFFRHRDVPVVTTADMPALTAAVEGLRPQVDRDAVEGTVRFQGTAPVAVEPRPGQRLDAAGAARALLAGWLRADPVTLPVTTTPVKVTSAAVHAAVDGVAKPAVAAPVVVHGDGADATLRPETVAAALRFTPTGDGGLAATLDHPTLVGALGPQLASTEQPGQDARIVLDSGRPVVQPSVDGRGVDWDVSLRGLPDLLKRPDGRVLTATYAPRPAAFTTEAADALGIHDVIGEFTTGGFAADSGVNIRTVAAKVNGAVVRPGQTFSLNGFTGPRTAAQGYIEAGVIENGAPARAVGGGISQFATTMYNAAYFAAMRDAGHREHSFYISRYPPAREATVFQNDDGGSVIDLRFTDDAPTGVVIQTIWRPSSITVRLWGTKRYNVESIPGDRHDFTDPPTITGPAGPDCHAGQGAQGFTTSDTRVIRDLDGREVRRETRTVKYNPAPKVVCAPPPAPGSPAGHD